MKSYLYKHCLLAYFVTAVLLCFFLSQNFAIAQTGEEVNELRMYIRDTYEETYDAPFEKIWEICKQIVTDEGCQIESDRIRENDDGTRRGVCKSEFCILSQDKDTVFKYLKDYTLQPPFIRGGVWNVFNCQTRLIVTEIDANNTKVVISLDLSSYESNVTVKSYSLVTRGYKEFLTFDRIRELASQ